MVWSVRESNRARKILKKAPHQIVRKYQFWTNMIQTQGPDAVKRFPGFRDEALKGAWNGFRSSRLNDQYRVIYRIDHQEVVVYVERIDPHTYRK